MAPGTAGSAGDQSGADEATEASRHEGRHGAVGVASGSKAARGSGGGAAHSAPCVTAGPPFASEGETRPCGGRRRRIRWRGGRRRRPTRVAACSTDAAAAQRASHRSPWAPRGGLLDAAEAGAGPPATAATPEATTASATISAIAACVSRSHAVAARLRACALRRAAGWNARPPPLPAARCPHNHPNSPRCPQAHRAGTTHLATPYSVGVLPGLPLRGLFRCTP